jgi:protein-S-isoprenylcysteine O-methyltransferase Ste14
MIMIKIAGIAIAVGAFSLACLARVQLGKAFAFTPQAKGLVTEGLYSRVKHPMYISVDIAICGIAIAAQSWWVLLPLLIMVPAQIRNCRKERQLLLAKFGEAYREYERETWF